MSTTVSGTIKGLEWKRAAGGHSTRVWVATQDESTLFTIERIHTGYLLDFYPRKVAAGRTFHPTVQEAKDDAQRQWESFIKGAIEPASDATPDDYMAQAS